MVRWMVDGWMVDGPALYAVGHKVQTLVSSEFFPSVTVNVFHEPGQTLNFCF